jgi:hypothetical protein
MITVFIEIDQSKYSDQSEKQKSFTDLTLLQKYDAILDVLFKESGNAPTFDDINTILLTEKKKIHWGEVMDILYTMIGDDYLYGHFTKTDVNGKPVQIFLISFNGKYLKDTGGFEKKIEREKAKEKLNKDLNDSNLKTGRWTRRNMIYTGSTAAITIIALITNIVLTQSREAKQNKQQVQDSVQKTKQQKLDSELNQEVRQIHQRLQDTLSIHVVK